MIFPVPIVERIHFKREKWEEGLKTVTKTLWRISNSSLPQNRDMAATTGAGVLLCGPVIPEDIGLARHRALLEAANRAFSAFTAMMSRILKNKEDELLRGQGV